jgi:hypothetical protein
MKHTVCAVSFCCITVLLPVHAGSQTARQATIEPETKARLLLQSHLSSKLSEPGDPIEATLAESLYVDGNLVLRRGTEFHGRVTEVTPARKGQKNGRVAILFDKIRMPWGDEPVAVTITAIDDWNKNEKLKSDEEGKVKGNRSGEKTARNVERGAVIGSAGALATVLLGGPGTAAGAGIAGSMLGGLLLTKGGDVNVGPGALFRIKFVKPLTLPVIQQSTAPPQPDQPAPDSRSHEKPPGSRRP